MQNIEKGGFLANLNKNCKTPVFNGYNYQKNLLDIFAERTTWNPALASFLGMSSNAWIHTFPWLPYALHAASITSPDRV